MIELKDICKNFNINKNHCDFVLKHINLTFKDKGFYFITGKSGSGKSTLLNILGGILLPSSGEMVIDNKSINLHSQKDLLEYRKKYVSFVFQDFNLIDDFSVLENLKLSGLVDEEKIYSILEKINLKEKINTKVCFLSGGEKQRLAIGRAIAKNSKIFLLDEPSGNLDQKNSKNIFDILKKISKEKLVIVVTHDQESVNKYGDYCYFLEDGSIVESSSLLKEIDFEEFYLDDDRIINIYKNIKNGNNVCNIKCESIQESIKFENKQIIKQINGKLKKYQGKAININFNDASIDESKDIKEKSYHPYISLKQRFHYAFKMIKKHIGRSIASIICFSLCLLLIFIQMSITWNDISQIEYQSIQENSLDYGSIKKEKYNKNINQLVEINTGKLLYQDIEKSQKEVPIMCFECSINETQDIQLFVIEKSIKFHSRNIEVPKNNEIVITSFLSSLNNNQEEGNLKLDGYSYENKYNLINLDDGYDEGIMYKYALNKLNDYQKDIIINQYMCAFVNKSFILNIFEKEKTFFNYCPLITNNKNDSLYRNRIKVLYQKYDSTIQLISGSIPKQKNEVCVTKEYINRYIIPFDSSIYNFDDVIGKKIYVRDLQDSPNKVTYENEINLFDITKEFVITGISDSTHGNEEIIYTSKNYYDEYCNLNFYYGTNIKVSINDLNKVRNLNDNKLLIDTNCINLIRRIEGFLKSNIMILLIVLEIILFVISIILLFLTCSIQVREKMKEICIFKSLGIKDSVISGIFLTMNTLITIISIIIGALLSFLGIFIMNKIFMSENVFDINFNLLNTNFYTLLIVLPLCGIIVLLSTLYPFSKIKKIDLAIALKNF